MEKKFCESCNPPNALIAESGFKEFGIPLLIKVKVPSCNSVGYWRIVGSDWSLNSIEEKSTILLLQMFSNLDLQQTL